LHVSEKCCTLAALITKEQKYGWVTRE
jgi:hypothetical protein